MNSAQLTAAFDEIKQEARELAGGLDDLTKRADIHRAIFKDSRGNHAFPLIAAHGALWGRGYFEFGLKLARVLSLQFVFHPELRRTRLAQVHEFADAIRNVNRRICIDTYTNYIFTKRYGHLAEAAQFVPAELLAALNSIHAAAAKNVELSEEQKREIFRVHFLYEQEDVVGARILDALEKHNWPLLKALSMKPLVKFSFMRIRDTFWFRDFANRDERIRRGLETFDLAAATGWSTVEAQLSDYPRDSGSAVPASASLC